jgi:hypothetical protein
MWALFETRKSHVILYFMCWLPKQETSQPFSTASAFLPVYISSQYSLFHLGFFLALLVSYFSFLLSYPPAFLGSSLAQAAAVRLYISFF